jgi:ABC-type multidrug transport system ATPase subunit
LFQDELIGELTVRETFRISARLRLSASDADIERDVEALIAGLGLSHVADNVIGTLLKRGLSGGEKRRVSVGVELAARPTVICLDEPTSESAHTHIQPQRNAASSIRCPST